MPPKVAEGMPPSVVEGMPPLVVEGMPPCDTERFPMLLGCLVDKANTAEEVRPHA